MNNTLYINKNDFRNKIQRVTKSTKWQARRLQSFIHLSKTNQQTNKNQLNKKTHKLTEKILYKVSGTYLML